MSLYVVFVTQSSVSLLNARSSNIASNNVCSTLLKRDGEAKEGGGKKGLTKATSIGEGRNFVPRGNGRRLRQVWRSAALIHAQRKVAMYVPGEGDVGFLGVLLFVAVLIDKSEISCLFRTQPLSAEIIEVIKLPCLARQGRHACAVFTGDRVSVR